MSENRVTSWGGGCVFSGGPVTFGGSADLIAFYGATPVAKSATYTVTNPTTDRALNVTGDTLAQGLQVLGTLIADLKAIGLIG